MTGRKVAGTAADPTLPKTPVTIGGTTYQLCFDLGALAEAETAINAELLRANSDKQVNLLAALPVQDLASTRALFAAGLRAFHPEISYAEAVKLLDFSSLYDVAIAVRTAWGAASPEADKGADPPRADE